MTINLPWHTGIPKTEGLHLVAIKLGENSGYYAFSSWNGNEWSQSFPENVIAFYPANELMHAIDIKWPEPEAPEPAGNLPPPHTPEDWEEVT